MRLLHLDFVRARPPLQAWSVVLLGLGVLAAGTVLVRSAGLYAEIDALEHGLASESQASPASRGDGPLGADETAALAREVAQANQVAASLNLAWPALFKRLEAIRVRDVSLLAIQPDSGGGGRRLRITGEAASLDSALAYVAALAATSGFGNAYLASHERVSDGGRVVIQFVAVTEWLASP